MAQQVLAEDLVDVLLFRGVAHAAGDIPLFDENAVVAAGDRRREQGELLGGDPRDFVGVFTHGNLIGVDDCEPEFGIVAAQFVVGMAVQAVVVEN